MSNKLKNFISDNRKAFDDELPSDKVWENIEASFTGRKKSKSILSPFYKRSMAAAAVLIIALSVYFIVEKEPKEKIVAGTGEMEIEKLAPEYVQPISQFVKLIDTRQEELKTLAKDQPALYQQFATAINQLDSSYNTLKNQLSATPNREMLLEAMIQNLQLQLNVLNQQLNIIHQIKDSKKNSHEKNT